MIKHSTILDDQEDQIFHFPQTLARPACGYSFCDKSNFSQPNLSPQTYANQNIFPGSQLNYFKKMEHAYSQHKIDEAFNFSQLLMKDCQEKDQPLSSQGKKLVERVQMQKKDVEYFEGKVHQEGWQVQKQKKNVKVSTKYEGQTVGVLVEAQLDVEIQKFLCVMVETDLMRKFMPFMTESKTEKILGRNNRIGYSLNDFPLLTNREAFFQGIGYDRISHNKTILVISRTLHDRPDLQRMLDYEVNPTPGNIQLDYHYFVLEYKPTSPNSGTIKLAINADLKLSLPMFILGAASESFGLDFYRNVLKIAKKFQGSEWEKRTKENPDFFLFLKRRIKEEFCDSS